MVELWDDPKLLNEPAYFKWLSRSIDIYPETLNQDRCTQQLNFENGRWSPLEPAEHPLAIEQRDGMTIKRVREIVDALARLDLCSPAGKKFCGKPTKITLC